MIRIPHRTLPLASLCAAALLLIQPHFARAQSRRVIGNFTVGYAFGEMPVPKSFKKDLALGYHVNDRAWIGLGYEDSVERWKTMPINAAAGAADRPTHAVERVGRKAYVMARIRPHPRLPFASFGAVVSDRSTETVFFAGRAAVRAGLAAETIGRRTTVGPSIRPAAGIGYRLTFGIGVSGFVEYSRWWLAPAPAAVVATYAAPDVVGRVPMRTAARTATSRVETYQALRFGLAYTM